jgi:hypothetical protein
VNVLLVLGAFALLAVVVAVIAAPLRAAVDRPPGEPAEAASPQLGELEAAREAKYREIRDAELDFRTGKLSREDYEAIDGDLRGEALAILDRLDALAKREQARPADAGSATPRDA